MREYNQFVKYKLKWWIAKPQNDNEMSDNN